MAAYADVNADVNVDIKDIADADANATVSFMLLYIWALKIVYWMEKH